MEEMSPMTTTTPELMGIIYAGDGAAAVKVRVSLAVMNDPIARSTNTGTRVCELDCQNDDEERVRITVWREHADLLADKIKKGDLVQFTGLSAKKVYNSRFAYGALPYSLNYSNGSNFTVVDSSYRLAGMPVTTLEDLEADIEFLQSSPTDPRVRVKARVAANGLSPFCQGVIGSVLAYNPSEPDKTLPLKVQVEFVPAEKRKSLVGGTKLEMRGMVALPQLQGDPAEFRVVSFSDIDLRDNGLGQWLTTVKSSETTPKQVAGGFGHDKATAVAVLTSRTPVPSKPKSSPNVCTVSKSPSVKEVVGSELTYVKGIVLDEFAADTAEGVFVGTVYVKDLRAHVTVSVHGATEAGVSAFKEGRLIEMRGVLYEDGGQSRIDVVWPQIARSGRLLALPKASALLPPTAMRALASDLKSESKGLKLITGKVVADGEQRGAHACFDVFVKDASGKCAITVAVVGDLRDVQASEIVQKDVDFKGVLMDNGTGELVFVVSGWHDLIPCGADQNVNVPESPSIVSLKKNFDFMSTNSPSTKTSESSTSIECSTAAVAANEADRDVFVVGAGQIQPVGNVVLKEEKLVDLANDPSFSMLQQGGGQLQPAKRRSSVDVFQQPAVPPPKPRSSRKKPSGNDHVETPTKKAKPLRASARRGKNWLQKLGELESAEATKENTENAGGDSNEEDSSSSATTFNDAHSNFSAASNSGGKRQVDFSSFIDDEAKEVNQGGLDHEADEDEFLDGDGPGR